MRITTKLFLIWVGILVAVVTSGGYLLTQSHRSIQAEAEKNIFQVAHLKEEALIAFMEDTEKLAKFISETENMRAYVAALRTDAVLTNQEEQVAEQLLHALQEEYWGVYHHIFVIEADTLEISLSPSHGDYIPGSPSSHVGENVANESWVNEAIETNRPTLSDYSSWTESDHNHQMLFYPMSVDDDVVALLGFELQIPHELDLLGGEQILGSTQRAFLLTSEGAPIEYQSSEDAISYLEHAGVQQALETGEFFGITSNEVGKEVIGLYIVSDEFPWIMAIEVCTDEVFAPVQEALNVFAIALVLMIVSSAFLLGYANRTVLGYTLDIERFKHAVDESTDAIIFTTPDFKMIYANRAWEKLTGYKFEEMEGEIPTVLKANSSQKDGVNLLEVMQSEDSFETDDLSDQHKDGSTFNTSLSVYPIISAGKTHFYVLLQQDITQRKLVDKAKTEFVSLASHQLRTPLTTVNWAIEMLLGEEAGSLNQEQKEQLTMMYESNGRMVDLVNALLNVSRLELGTFQIEPVPANIVSMAESVIEEQQPQIEEMNHEVRTDFDTSLGDIAVDPQLLRMVLQNLISNAIKYTPHGGKITCSIKKDSRGENVKICVQDTGIGIAKSEQKNIFNKLFRAPNAISLQTEGNGLGLYIAKSVLEESGGTIGFKSQKDKGTTFTVTLPLSGMKGRAGDKTLNPNAPQARVRAIQEKKEATTRKAPLILIVEDTPGHMAQMVQELEGAQYDVIEAKDGKVGYELALKKKPDLIILDILMPKMDGLEMEQRLRQDPWGKDVPIIVLSNFDESKEIRQIAEGRKYAYLLKSDTSLDRLMEKVKAILA
jgi:PAS domain S-box-containing protein